MKTLSLSAICSIVVIISFVAGCSTNPQSVQEVGGNVQLVFQKSAVPEGVKILKTTISRGGYATRVKELNLNSDTTQNIYFEKLEVGTWTVKIDAQSDSGKVLFTGSSDVMIYENTVSQLTVILNPVSSGVGSVTIGVVWGNTPTGSWVDYPLNPILNPPLNQDIGAGIYLPKIILDAGKYYMFYNMGTGYGGVSVATSMDGLGWTHQSSVNVIPLGQPDAWDGTAVGIGGIIKEHNLFKLYFNAYGKDGRFRIGLATSTDGIHWTKYSTPIYEGDTTWNYSVVSASIVKNENEYLLYFSGRAKNSSSYSIGVLSSQDGLSFKRKTSGPIISPTSTWEGQSTYWPSVTYENGLYTMIYMNSSAGTSSGFGMATSSDGVQWSKNNSNPILLYSKATFPWNISEIAYPFLLKLNNESRIYYSGFSTTGYKIGVIIKK